jgi:hypothetical protein
VGEQTKFNVIADPVKGISGSKIKASAPGLFYDFSGSEKFHELNLNIILVTGNIIIISVKNLLTYVKRQYNGNLKFKI